VAEHLLLILFFLYIGGTLLESVMRSERVTLDKVSAALCSYLLLGMVWSFLFSLVELLVPGSFQFAATGWKAGAQDMYGRSGFSNALYFSFTTLTTLGFGDITPHTRLAQNLSAMEAVMGQVYMTVLVARLVGMEISHSSRTRPS
jgi:voltage-gated potassium channel